MIFQDRLLLPKHVGTRTIPPVPDQQPYDAKEHHGRAHAFKRKGDFPNAIDPASPDVSKYPHGNRMYWGYLGGPI